MKFEPFEKKIVAILSEKIETGRAMNALGHMAFGLAGSHLDKKELRLQDYYDADNGKHPAISDIPFIILKGKSNHIREIRKAAQELGISFTDFTHTMIGETYVEQHANTSQTKEQDLEYFGICLFGDWNTVSQLTKKFSLWR